MGTTAESQTVPMFSQPVELVSDTLIYGRVADGQQFVAYEMNISTPTETAMVLPVPVLHLGRVG